MSYIQRNTHKPEERKYNPQKIYLMRVLLVLSRRQPFVSGFYGRVSSWKCFLLDARRASLTADGPSTHTCTHPGRIDGCVARLKWIRRIENNNVVKKNFIQLVVVRQPETWRKTVSKSRRMICV